MLDLKSKLLAAGLVTQEQVDKALEEKSKRHIKAPRHYKRQSPPPEINQKDEDDFEKRQRQKQVQELKSRPKNEQYDMIRRWVTRNRLDKQSGMPSEEARKYFFHKSDNNISWLTLEPEIYERVADGRAGIMAFMSHHGLAHCVVAKDIIEDVSEVFPEWLRVLVGHPLHVDSPKDEEEIKHSETI